MAQPPAIIRLTEEEKNILSEWSRQGAEDSQLVERARIILLSNEDLTVEEIARHLQTRPARVSKWRQRFAKHRLFGLSDIQRSGNPGRYDEQTERRVLDLLESTPPQGNAQWNGRLVAQALGDVSQAQVWRILRRHEVQLERRHSWSILTEPEFAPKAADIVGLYLDPPESALVLCVDDMPQARQAEAARGYLRLTNGKAARNFQNRDGADGAITLSEALAAMTGQMEAGQAQQRCRRQFLDFMNDVLDSRPGQKIHVVLNHLSANKPKWDRWLQRHSRVRLHFTPNYASWLNQAECWFSMLGSAALSGASFAQPRELREGIEAFVAAHRHQTTPFEWAKVLEPAMC
jgi:transposase